MVSDRRATKRKNNLDGAPSRALKGNGLRAPVENNYRMMPLIPLPVRAYGRTTPSSMPVLWKLLPLVQRAQQRLPRFGLPGDFGNLIDQFFKHSIAGGAFQIQINARR